MRENAVPGGATMAGAAPAQAVSPAASRGGAIDTLVWLGARSVYALLALGLRLVMARVFFLSGQAKIEGPGVPIPFPGRRGRPLGDAAGRHQGNDFPAVRDAICRAADRPGARRLSLQLCRVCAADLLADRICHPPRCRMPVRLDDAAANLRRAGDVVAVARVL